MADLTNIALTKNGFKELTFANGAADQDLAPTKRDSQYILLVRNDDANAATVTIKEGTAFGAQGDVSQAVAQNKYFTFGPFDSALFKKLADGKINIDITDADGTAFSGTITDVKVLVMELPY